MNIGSTQLDGILVLRPEGPELGADRAEAFRQALLPELESSRWVAIDLSEVEFMDSSGLGAVVAALKALRGRGELRLFGVHPRIEELFRLTGLNRVFSVDTNQVAAVTQLRAAKEKAGAA